MSKTIKFTISGDANKAADQFVVIRAASPRHSNSILLQILRDEKPAEPSETTPHTSSDEDLG